MSPSLPKPRGQNPRTRRSRDGQLIEASWTALLDAIYLELMRLTEKDSSVEKVVEDYCWGV